MCIQEGSKNTNRFVATETNGGQVMHPTAIFKVGHCRSRRLSSSLTCNAYECDTIINTSITAFHHLMSIVLTEIIAPPYISQTEDRGANANENENHHGTFNSVRSVAGRSWLLHTATFQNLLNNQPNSTTTIVRAEGLCKQTGSGC